MHKANFIDYEIWILSFGGGFQRANVYANNVGKREKAKFRAEIREKINEIVADKYHKSTVSSSDHINVLTELKQWIDSRFSSILKNDEIKFGVVQKLVNLYLKYQWCLGLIDRPPHCPFDRIVIEKLKLEDPPNWTEINDIDIYKKLVEKAAEAAKPISIAEWELVVFSRRS